MLSLSCRLDDDDEDDAPEIEPVGERDVILSSIAAKDCVMEGRDSVSPAYGRPRFAEDARPRYPARDLTTWGGLLLLGMKPI